MPGANTSGSPNSSNPSNTPLTNTLINTSDYMQAFYANYLIYSAGLLALVYAGYCFYVIYRIKMTKDTIRVNILSEDERDSLLGMQ